MRRTPPIRITKNDKQEYARLVRNAKAKVRRTLENYGIDLTNEIQIPSIEDFETRSQFNDWKNKQRSFTNVSNRNYQFKKNEWGVVATKKELDDIVANTKKAQRNADKIIKDLEKTPAVKQRMRQMAKPQNLTGVSKPNDFDFGKIRTRKQFEQKMKNMWDRADDNFYDKRMIILKDNFIKSLEENFHSDADVLIDKIKRIPPDDFYELYLYLVTEGEIDIDYMYTTDADGFETNGVISKINSYINRYMSGTLNMDMKGF